MKRSEIENLIRDVIKDEEGRPPGREPIGVKILDALLEVGMLPPAAFKEKLGMVVTDVDLLLGKFSIGTRYEAGMVNEWEPE